MAGRDIVLEAGLTAVEAGNAVWCQGCDLTRYTHDMGWTHDGRYLCEFCREVVCVHATLIELYCRPCFAEQQATGEPSPPGRMRADWPELSRYYEGVGYGASSTGGSSTGGSGDGVGSTGSG